MRCLLVLALAIGAAAQPIPGIGSDSLRKAKVPVTDTPLNPPRVDADEIHQKTLAELAQLIQQATALEKELKDAGPEKVSLDSAKRVDKMRRSLKRVEDGLKAK